MSTTTKAPTVQVTVATFDAPYDPEIPIFRVTHSAKLSKFRALGSGDYMPRGGTPLRDATMEMINKLDELRSEDTVQIGLLLDESGSMSGNREAVIAGVNEFIGGMRGVPANEGNRVLCVIFTDGLENASRNVSADVLAEAVGAREADDWTFIFMGANMDAWAEGRLHTGISGGVRGQSVNFVSTPVGTQAAFGETSRRSTSYLSGQKDYDQYASVAGNNSTVREDGNVEITDPTAMPSIPKPGGPTKPTPKKTPKKPKKAPKPTPKPKPYGDVGDAIKKASESQST